MILNIGKEDFWNFDDNPVLFVKLLQSGNYPLTDRQIRHVIDVMGDICDSCWNASNWCQCGNDD